MIRYVAVFDVSAIESLKVLSKFLKTFDSSNVQKEQCRFMSIGGTVEWRRWERKGSN
jgi:hypothetical protein